MAGPVDDDPQVGRTEGGDPPPVGDTPPAGDPPPVGDTPPAGDPPPAGDTGLAPVPGLSGDDALAGDAPLTDDGIPRAPAEGVEPEPPRRPAWRSRVVVPVAAAVLVGAGVAGWAAARGGDEPAQPATPATSQAAERFTTFRDREAGLTIAYPSAWERLEPQGDATVRLIVSAGGQNSLLVRVIELGEPVTEANLGDVKSVTDSIVSADNVRILEERTVSLNGMPGYYYLYFFDDEGSGQQGVHAHYFVFQGRRMNVLVFQALPSDDFSKLAPTFDRIAESFRSEPRPDEAPPASAAPTTKAP